MKRVFLAAAAAAALVAAPSARAQTGVHTHDGFYLHLEVGGGALGTSASAGGTKVELSGGGAQFAVGVGGAVTPALVVAGQLWSTGVASPTVKVNGATANVNDASVGLAGIGVELTYYLMPLDAYVSVVPSIGTLSTKVNGSSGSTKRGFALKAAIGKEWFVSDNWGLGLNLQYMFGSNQDKDTPGLATPTWKTSWFGAAVSATFN